MNRPFIFLSGEFRITLPIVFSHEKWQHCMNAKLLSLNPNGSFRRFGHDEELKAAIYYASVESEEIRRQNWTFIIANHIPCWPNPTILLTLDDRHSVMERCITAGLVNHRVIQCKHGSDIDLPYPYVVKTGNEHCGEGKHLVQCAGDLPKWDGIATIEPFFTGTSCRVLWIGDKSFTLRFDNPNSWIRNTSGAELSMFPSMPPAVIEHSHKVKNLFDLEVCGIDYIVNEDTDQWWFLEYNQFPGLDIDDNATPVINKFLAGKMKELEEQCNV